ncbi:TorF family putative porin [Falsihalocynthiibacter sp. SS001]|uniref:TorF family putative porin n=1 Tax=Falsihalocynthiibacter sp. SS001 TaxID=3349698 RepID=UPI0036D43BB2
MVALLNINAGNTAPTKFAGSLVLGGVAMFAASGAFAQEAASPFLSSPFTISGGVDFTTNYVSKGFTQSDNKPAIQPYLEIGYGSLYFALWGSNVDFGDEDIEVDVELGWLTTLGSVDLAIGFAQYFYRDDDADYGEAFISAEYAFSEDLSMNAQYWYEVYAYSDVVYVGAEYGGFHEDVVVSGGVGTDFGTRGFDQDAVYGDLGVTWNFAENLSVDVRGNYSAIEEERLIATFSVAF